MKIGIEINGVLRDTLKKIQEVYEKWYIENPFLEEDETIERGLISDVTTLDLKQHLKFKDDDEVYDFLYKEYAMEIFGHSGSVEYTGMNDLNDFYIEMRELHDIYIISDEIGKSKPATLFFLSKFGCLVENIKFYSEATIDSMWNTIDILVTANPKLLVENQSNKTLIKFKTSYNSDITVKHTIESIKDLKSKISEIC